jgi:hypothetical protein
MEHIGQIHPFAKGMGIAAPQIGIGRAAAVVAPAEPGAVPRPLRITVQTTAVDGTTTNHRLRARAGQADPPRDRPPRRLALHRENAARRRPHPHRGVPADRPRVGV